MLNDPDNLIVQFPLYNCIKIYAKTHLNIILLKIRMNVKNFRVNLNMLDKFEEFFLSRAF